MRSAFSNISRPRTEIRSVAGTCTDNLNVPPAARHKYPWQLLPYSSHLFVLALSIGCFRQRAVPRLAYTGYSHVLHYCFTGCGTSTVASSPAYKMNIIFLFERLHYRFITLGVQLWKWMRWPDEGCCILSNCPKYFPLLSS